MASADLTDNLTEVRKEAMGMLKTISKVKGKKYAAAVQTLLLIKQVAEISGLMCQLVREQNESMAEAFSHALSKSLGDIGYSLPTLTDYGDDDFAEIVKDVEALSENVSHLVNSAVQSYRSGAGFGGKDAA